MKINKLLVFVGVLLLIAAVVAIILSIKNRSSVSGLREASDLRLAKEASVSAVEKGGDLHEDGQGTKLDGDHGPTVKVSGLGSLSYATVREGMDLNELLFRCGKITEGDYETRLETGRKATADVYLSENGEIVHICYQKGLYKTKSRDVEAMADLGGTGLPPHGNIEIIRIGVPGLTLQNTEMLKYVFGNTVLGATVSGEGNLEVEVTPVVGKVTDAYNRRADYIGREFPMVLQKYTGGMPSRSDFIEGYQGFRREDLVRRDWKLTPFLPDPKTDGGRLPPVSDGGVYDEPLLKAWERKQAEISARPGSPRSGD